MMRETRRTTDTIRVRAHCMMGSMHGVELLAEVEHLGPHTDRILCLIDDEGGRWETKPGRKGWVNGRRSIKSVQILRN